MTASGVSDGVTPSAPNPFYSRCLMTTSRLFTFFLSWLLPSPLVPDQSHTLGDSFRPSTAACPACWAMGTNELKYCMMRKKYIVLCRVEQPSQNKNPLCRHDKPNKPTKKGPFHLFSLSPHTPQFQQVSRDHLSLVSLFQTGRQPYP